MTLYITRVISAPQRVQTAKNNIEAACTRKQILSVVENAAKRLGYTLELRDKPGDRQAT